MENTRRQASFQIQEMDFVWGQCALDRMFTCETVVARGHYDDQVIFWHPSFRTRAQTRAENIPRKALKTINCENSTSALNKTPNPASVVSFPNFIIILQSTIETASFRIDSPNTFSLMFFYHINDHFLNESFFRWSLCNDLQRC